MTKHLSKEFYSLSEAEEALQIDYIGGNNFGHGGIFNTCAPESSTSCYSTMVDEPMSPVFQSSPTMKENTVPHLIGDLIEEFLACFKSMMSSRLKNQLLKYLLKLVALEHGSYPFLEFIHQDFLDKCMNAMMTLFEAGKHNIVYDLCECLQRQDCDTKTRMPLDRMPYGLIDYNIRFFASSQTRKLTCEEHYASWMETMFSHFGHKWLSLHRGPVWQYQEHKEEIVNPAMSLVEIALYQSGIDLQPQKFQDDGDTLLSVSELDFTLANMESSLISNEENQESIELNLDSLSLSDCKVNELEPTSKEPSCAQNKHARTVTVVDDFCDNTRLAVPNLWTCVSESDAQEIESGLRNPKEMEKHHGIAPVLSKRVERNSGIFDPLKVGLKMCILCVLHDCFNCSCYCKTK